MPRGEAMLAYVAVTRAKQALDRGGLPWIDDQLAGVARPGRRDRHERQGYDYRYES
mgnify:CR=1 FL=1